MNIAFFNKQLPSDQPNGVSMQVHRLANALEKSGHRVTCFTFSPPPKDSIYNCSVLSWGVKLKLFRKFIPALRFRLVSPDKFDILHFHGDDYLCIGASKRVRTFYGSALQEALHAGSISRFLYQALFYFFEWVSCLKKGTLVGISKNTLRSLPKISRCIPCGVPLEKYNPRNDSKTLHPSILFLGGLNGRKRGSLVVDIFLKNILPQYPDSVLTIVGPQLCEGKNIVYIPKAEEDELIRLYQQHWIYCQASSYEGFGVPALEAMACGTAVVAVKNTGSREIITDGLDGFCCNRNQLRDRLLDLIGSAKLREKFVQNGLHTVRRFDVDVVASMYIELYQSVMNHSHER